MITFNFEDGTFDDNYENADSTIDNTIEEREEDDSDSGIDSLYECIKHGNSDCKQGKSVNIVARFHKASMTK